jgi:hypothetical protein
MNSHNANAGEAARVAKASAVARNLPRVDVAEVAAKEARVANKRIL